MPRVEAPKNAEICPSTPCPVVLSKMSQDPCMPLLYPSGSRSSSEAGEWQLAEMHVRFR